MTGIAELEARLYELRCDILLDHHVSLFRRIVGLSADEYFQYAKSVDNASISHLFDDFNDKFREYIEVEKELGDLRRQ